MTYIANVNVSSRSLKIIGNVTKHVNVSILPSILDTVTDFIVCNIVILHHCHFHYASLHLSSTPDSKKLPFPQILPIIVIVKVTSPLRTDLTDFTTISGLNCSSIFLNIYLFFV